MMKTNDYYEVLGKLRAAIPALDSKGCEVNLIVNREAISVDINHYSTKRKKIVSTSVLVFDNSEKEKKIEHLAKTLEDIVCMADVDEAILIAESKYNDKFLI